MKMKASLKAVGFAVMMAAASMSHAETTDWGTVAPGTTFSTELDVPRLGVFEDIYNFSLMTSGMADMRRSVTITLNEFGDRFSGFIGLDYGIYSGATDALVDYSSFNSSTNRYMYSDLAAGDYYLKVSGEGWRLGDAVDVPQYNALVNITAAPTPEPETYAMFFAGLGILGTVVRRRSRSF